LFKSTVGEVGLDGPKKRPTMTHAAMAHESTGR